MYFSYVLIQVLKILIIANQKLYIYIFIHILCLFNTVQDCIMHLCKAYLLFSNLFFYQFKIMCNTQKL